MSARVLVVGESLIDIVDRGGVRSRHVGGSPLNVAFGLGRLGIPTVFATEFGDDDDGAAIAAHLASAGVEVQRTDASPRPTATAIAHIGGDGSASYEFDLEWAFTQPPATAGVSAVHVGSIGALRLPGAEGVLALVEALPPDVFVSFDPNIRPALVSAPAVSRELVERYAARADLVKLSDEDAAWLYPSGGASERLLACGARLVAVTRGGEGSTLYSALGSTAIPAVPTIAVDTIGAGDAYMTGLLAAVLRRPAMLTGSATAVDLATVGRVAAVAAGITVGRAGAMPPTAAELDRALREVDAA